jgi:hypothetical protein
MDHASTANETAGSQPPATERTEETALRADARAHSPSLARFYMTSDLRTATGLTRTHLDFYLREGVIVPTARTESGYLLFDDDELSVLRQVIAWRQSGVGVRDILTRLGRDESGNEALS